MPVRKRTSPLPPGGPPDPTRGGAARAFRSAEHLVAWIHEVEGRPVAIRAVTPRHLGELSAALARVASEPHGGAVLVLGRQDPEQRAWLEEARLEHGVDAISGPWPVRVEGEAGLLVGVAPSEAPTAWETWEPDAWPVPAAADSPLDAHLVRIFMRAQPLARPVGTSEAEHEAEVLAQAGARRWFRGQRVPTIAGLVAFGQATERFLPGAAVAVRWPGRAEQLHQGPLPWLVRRLTEERALWGAAPPDVAAAIIVLALAERAWAGPDARTPITASVETSGLRLAIPTRAANRREQEDRAPGNPRLRQLLVRSGLLPTGSRDEVPDNEEVLSQLDGRYPGIRHRFDDELTWLEVPWRPAARAARRQSRVEAKVARPGGAALDAPSLMVVPGRPAEPVARVEGADAGGLHVVAPANAPPATTPVGPAPPPPRPSTPIAVARSAPLFHPRSPPPPAEASAEIPAIRPLVLPPSPPAAPVAPSASPPVGPRTLGERKAELRDLFLAADRPLALRELAESLGVHRDTLTPAIKALIAEGWLEPTDPNPRSPVQRYRRVAD